jgi:hypothetical protein
VTDPTNPGDLPEPDAAPPPPPSSMPPPPPPAAPPGGFPPPTPAGGFPPPSSGSAFPPPAGGSAFPLPAGGSAFPPPTEAMPVAGAPLGPPPGPPATKGKGPIIAAVAVVALVLGGLAFVAFGGDDDKQDVSSETTTTEKADGPGGKEGASDEGDKGEDPTATTASGGAQAYGDDPALDALYDECEAGDFQACDDLYMDSPFGSEYEDFGDTCGERNEPQGYCVDLYSDGGGDDGSTDSIDGSGAMSYGDNAQLDALYDQCEAGDFQACDTLYMESDFGSEYEDFGDTCGDRNEPQGYCVDVYADDGGE